MGRVPYDMQMTSGGLYSACRESYAPVCFQIGREDIFWMKVPKLEHMQFPCMSPRGLVRAVREWSGNKLLCRLTSGKELGTSDYYSYGVRL